jgi:DNA-binding Xre family transcriptional regulator
MVTVPHRLGFLNARLVRTMNERNMSVRELAHATGVTYEHIRKILVGACLPSDSILERLCEALLLSRREMRQRLAKDRAIKRYGDAAWSVCGLDPKLATLYIVLPLLNKEEWKFVRITAKALAEDKKSA